MKLCLMILLMIYKPELEMKLHYLLIKNKKLYTPITWSILHGRDERKWRKAYHFSIGFQTFIDFLSKLHLGVICNKKNKKKKQGTHHDVMPVHLCLLRGQFLTFQLQTSERKQKTVAWVSFIGCHDTLLQNMQNLSEQNILQTFSVCKHGARNTV